jgi:hypothetical protein
MTRTRTLSTLWCTALVATLAAYGCGSSSTIDTGTGGRAGGTGGRVAGSGGSGVIIIGTGGMTGTGGGPGGIVDGGAPMCMAGATCTAGFTCTLTCTANMGRGPGTRACTCGGNMRVNCMACIPDDAGAPVDTGPAVDAGPICAGGQTGPATGRACVVGTDMPCTRNPNGANPTMCTCVGIPADAGVDAAVGPRWVCL